MSTIYTDPVTGRHYSVDTKTGQSHWEDNGPPAPPNGPPPGQAGRPPAGPGLPGGTPPPKQKHRVRNVVLVAIGAVAVITVATSLSGGGSTGTGSKNAPQTVAASAGSKATAPSAPAKGPGVGTPVRDGKFEFTVTKVKSGVASVGTADFGAKAQGQFVVVSLTVKNIGNEAQIFDGSSQILFDSQGRKFSADTAAAIYLDESQSFLNTINPGNLVTGTILFDVAKGTQLSKIELHDSPFSGGVPVTLK